MHGKTVEPTHLFQENISQKRVGIEVLDSLLQNGQEIEVVLAKIAQVGERASQFIGRDNGFLDSDGVFDRFDDKLQKLRLLMLLLPQWKVL